jgi:hypothetical protein
MNLLSLFRWLGHSAVGLYMQRSTWAFAVVETVHLIALAAVGGAVLAIQLTTLGVIRRIQLSKLAMGLFPAMIGCLAVLIVTGVLMVSEESLKCYYSQAFRAKMLALALAIIVFIPLHAIQAKSTRERAPWWLKVGSAVSLLLWLSVGLAGRAIGVL